MDPEEIAARLLAGILPKKTVAFTERSAVQIAEFYGHLVKALDRKLEELGREGFRS